ncbi:MAG: lysylphosphatidylglycerol synthase transmembrane domain-containing protein [Bdellovibrionales bacterium]
MTRSRLVIAAKLALSGGIIYLLGQRFEARQLLESMHGFDPSYLLASIFCAVLAVPIVGYRWVLLAKALSVSISFVEAVNATFAGLFVGQILPGAIGADLVRGWMVWRAKVSNKRMIASLVLDRVVSLGAVGLMIAGTLPFLIVRLPREHFLWVVWSLLGLTGCLIAAYVGLRLFGRISKNLSLRAMIDKLDLKRLKLSVSDALVLAALGIAGHVAMIVSAYFLSKAIGMNSALWMWMLVMPVVILASAIPLSINGWGVREFMMIQLWASFGFLESEAFLTSVCLGAVAMASSLPGVWFYLKRKSGRSRESLEKYAQGFSKRLV